MSGVIDVVNRRLGADDIKFGNGSFVYVDINGVARRLQEVNASHIPLKTYATNTVDNLVDGSESLPVSASKLTVQNTSTFSGLVYVIPTASGFVKNQASGKLTYGNALASGDMPTGIPAVNVGSGLVDNEEFNTLDGVTTSIQTQINALSTQVSGVGWVNSYKPRNAASLRFIGSGTARVWVNTSTTDAQALVPMNGFPDVVNTDQMVDMSITDGQYRANTSPAYCYFPSAAFGTERVSQWYAILAVASMPSTALTPFELKAMPYLRQKSQAGQSITVGTNPDPTVGTDYNLPSLASGRLYVLTGADAGAVRTVNTNSIAGGYTTVDYAGGTVMGNGDWFIILPHTYNFRWLGDVYNDSAGNFTEIGDLVMGRRIYRFMTAGAFFWYSPFTWREGIVSGTGGGGGGDGLDYGGGAGAAVLRGRYTCVPGIYYTGSVGAGGAATVAGGSTYLSAANTAAMVTLAGGGVASGYTKYSNGVLVYGGGAGNIFGAGGHPSTSAVGGQGYGGGGNAAGGGANGFLQIEKAD